MQQDKQTLINDNGSYHSQHILTDQDAQLANIYSDLIELSRSNIAPKVGDLVLLATGEYAHIENTENEYLNSGDFTLVRGYYVPFTSISISDSKIKIKTNTSGGPWLSIDANKLAPSPIATRERNFCFFGHCGMRASGAITFRAVVNVWQEVEQLTRQEMEKLQECDGKHKSIKDICECESCSILLK